MRGWLNLPLQVIENVPSVLNAKSPTCTPRQTGRFRGGVASLERFWLQWSVVPVVVCCGGEAWACSHRPAARPPDGGAEGRLQEIPAQVTEVHSHCAILTRVDTGPADPACFATRPLACKLRGVHGRATALNAQDSTERLQGVRALLASARWERTDHVPMSWEEIFR